MHLCEGCHAGCCRSFAVPVNGADILKIQREYQLLFWDAVCRWADPEGLVARNYAPHFYFDDEPETPFTLCLIHDKSKTFPQTTKCRFLVETAPDADHPLGTAHCGIYDQRPSACRAFPTKLNHTGELAIINTVPEKGRDGDDPAYQLCPRQWEPGDLDPLTVLPDLVVARYEMTFFHKVAEVWNRRKGAWRLFPEFLELVYANRIKPIEALDQLNGKTTPETGPNEDSDTAAA